jgi:hypothetical protein
MRNVTQLFRFLLYIMTLEAAAFQVVILHLFLSARVSIPGANGHHSQRDSNYEEYPELWGYTETILLSIKVEEVSPCNCLDCALVKPRKHG